MHEVNRDMLTPMNYRRGLQRLYLALTVVWIAAVVLTVLPGRWRPWLALNIWEMDLRPDAPTLTASLADIDEVATAALEVHTRRVWTIGLSLIPPILVYLFVFYIAPWLYRGFRPKAHN